MTDRRAAIEIRAHQLWEEAGRPDGSGLEYWLAAEREHADLPADAESEDNPEIQGEGNYVAAEEYNNATKKFAKSGKVEEKARQAAADRDNPSVSRDLDDAERVGKAHSHGEDPALAEVGGRDPELAEVGGRSAR